MLAAKAHWLTTASCSLMAAFTVMATAPPRRPGGASDNGHAELKRHVEELTTRVRALGDLSSDEQQAAMTAIAGALDEKLRTQNDWEERALYPIIDARTTCAGVAMSAVMKIEHARMAQSLDVLSELARAPAPDARRFSQVFERLVGLLLGHLEVEDRALLPLLEPDPGAARGSPPGEVCTRSKQGEVRP